jgi:TolC family type I secretion outer membrane protein
MPLKYTRTLAAFLFLTISAVLAESPEATPTTVGVVIFSGNSVVEFTGLGNALPDSSQTPPSGGKSVRLEFRRPNLSCIIGSAPGADVFSTAQIDWSAQDLVFEYQTEGVPKILSFSISIPVGEGFQEAVVLNACPALMNLSVDGKWHTAVVHVPEWQKDFKAALDAKKIPDGTLVGARIGLRVAHNGAINIAHLRAVPKASAFKTAPTPEPQDPSAPASNEVAASPATLGSTAAAPDSELQNVPAEQTAPAQSNDPLAADTETQAPQETAKPSMTKEMAVTEFYKQLDALIAKQRNPKVPDMKLEDAIKAALQKNPDILDGIQKLSLTSGQMISVRSRITPQISLTSDWGYTSRELNQVEVAGADVTDQVWNINLEFTQLLYDGGATVSRIRSAIASEHGAYFELRAIIDQVISEVKINFSEIVLNRALIIANQQSVDLLTEQLKDQQNRYDAGTVPRFNVLQAEVALANAKPPLIQAQNNYRVAMYRLVRLLGMDYPPGFPSEVPFNIVGKLDYKPRALDPDNSIRIAVARNPGLKAQRQSILSTAAKVNEQAAGYMPTIRARVAQTNNSDMLTSKLSNVVSGWFFGINGTWPLWDGLLTHGNMKQAKAQLDSSKINYDDGVREVILEVQQAISNLLQAKETVDSQEASMAQGVEALRLSQERLDAGAGTQLDVLNQQTSLLQSQTYLLQAYFSYIKGVAEYERTLSLDTRYEEFFDDPLTRPEAKRFQNLNNPDRPQPNLPRAFRKSDPIKPILEPAPSPSPTPKVKNNPPAKTIKGN